MRFGDVLQHHRLAGARRRDDQTTLTFADRRQQIDDPGRVIVGLCFEPQALVRIERRQVVEKNFFARSLRVFVVDRFDLEQGEIALAFFGRANMTRDDVAGAQVKAANLARRNVNVVGPGKIVVVGRAQKTESVRQGFQNALAVDMAVLLGLRLQDRKDQLLLAHVGGALDVEIFADQRQIADLFSP